MKSEVIKAAARQTRQGASDNFVGTVLQDPVFSAADGSGTKVTRVTFTPGGRTNWHAHESGQVLYVISGVGRYQLEGEGVQEIKPGDTVVIPAKRPALARGRAGQHDGAPGLFQSDAGSRFRRSR